MHMNIYLNKV